MKPEYKALGSFGTLGLEIVLCIIVGYFGGHFIDGKLGTEPGFTIFGFICGLGAAGKAILRTVKEMKEVTAQEEREQGNPTPRIDPPNDPPSEPPSKEDGDG